MAYQIEYQDNGGPWKTLLTETLELKAPFSGELYHAYTFRVRARDLVGHTSDWITTTVAIVNQTKYYFLEGRRVAMRKGDKVFYLYGDHLGSTSLTTDEDGVPVSEKRYLPYGDERLSDGASPTDFGFTDQRNEVGLGLMDYNARYYDPYLNQFISPDTIIPDPTDSQNLNRYAYAYNNPIKYNDPTGHCGDCLLDAAFITYDIYQIQQEGWTPLNTAALVVDVTLAFVPLATGGGPGLRLAFAGGETAAQTALHVPSGARAAETILMAAQVADGNGSGSGSGGGGNPLDPKRGNIVLDKQFDVKRSDGSTITDFDSVEISQGELWLIEEKSAPWAGDPNKWVQKNIFDKASKFIEAIHSGVNVPFSWKSNNIGFRFEDEIIDPALQTAVENAVQELKQTHPDFNFELFIPD